MTCLSTPINGVDYYSEMSIAGIQAHGAKFVCRYLSNFPPKNLTPSEVRSLVANSIGVVSVWEDGASDALAGFDVGKSHAEQHVAMARNCGQHPNHGFYYFAVDFDTAGHPERTDAYFNGVASVIPKVRCGPYGGFEVVKHQLDRGFGAAWQSYAWSAGRLDSRAQIYQHLLGTSVDYDKAMFENYGQWQYDPPPPPNLHHYERFPDVKIEMFGKIYQERETVIAFDELQPHWHQHPLRHHELKHTIKMLRDRIWTLARQGQDAGEFNLPGRWNLFWRGWRWQELDKRLHLS